MAREHLPADSPGSAINTQTFEFEKRTFVSGLFWQPLPGSTAKQRLAETQKMSLEQGFDLAVLRTTGVPQVGFAAAADGVKAGMLSAAAMVSKSLEMANRDRSFLYAMPVPGGKWLYIAQREGVLLHDGDLLGTEEAIQTRMMSDLSLLEWQTVFAPAHWGVPNATQRSFEDLLPKTGKKYSFKKWWEVRPIRRNWLTDIHIKTPILGMLATLLIAGGIYYGWQYYSTKQALEEQARKEAEEQAARAAAVDNQPWKKLPPPEQFIAACDRALSKVQNYWPAGWDPESATCAKDTLVFNWIRQDSGRIEYLLSAQPAASISLDGGRASLTLPLDQPKGANDVLPKEKERILELLSIAQRYGIDFKFQNLQDNQPTLGEPTDVAPTWKTQGWNINDFYPAPSTIIPLFDGPGFRITLIKLSFTEGIMKWTMEGTQYAQP